MVDDVIDVILNNELFTDRLLRNPGNWGNNEIYEDLTTKFKELWVLRLFEFPDYVANFKVAYKHKVTCNGPVFVIALLL